MPSHVNFENERVWVRSYLPKPIQCFNRFKFGHSSRVCKNAKVFINCSTLDHGACSKTTKCSNCQLNHKANDKNCEAYKYEQSAVNKANAEHISIGYAKQQLGQSKSYARALNLLPLTTTRGPVGTPFPAVGVSTPVVEFQVSGSGAKSLKARAHSTKAGKLPVVGNESPPDDEAFPSSLPSPIFKVVNLSQAESLPDLMESEQLRNPRERKDSFRFFPLCSKRICFNIQQL